MIHGAFSSCTHHFIHTFLSSAKKILPLYASLTVVPPLFLKFGSVLRNPVHYAKGMVASLARSLAFLSSFVALYQGTICLQNQVIPDFNHRFIYYFAGLVASLSIFIERKQKHSELALYTLPRGLDSLFMMLVDRRLLAGIPLGEFLLFSVSLSLIMYYYEHERDSVPPVISRILQFVLNDNSTQIKRTRSFYSSPEEEDLRE